MRAILFFLVLVAALPACAGSCETLLCMAGKLQGQGGGSDCTQPVADYFSIIEYGKHWRFDPGATAAARLGYLNTCQADGVGDWPLRINAIYGAVE